MKIRCKTMAEEFKGNDDILGDLLRCCDKDAILSLIHDENVVKENLFKNVLAYHIIVEVLTSNPDLENVVTKLVYLLTLHGADINKQDQNGDTALFVYVRENEEISNDVLQAFLRCGSDVILKNKDDEDVLEFVLHSDDFPRHVKARLLEYMPGVWRAVEADDAMTVRRLINQWCSVHVEKDDLTVLQVAFNKGTENIIRAISGIGATMDLVHAVLAGDIVSARAILETSSKYNINLKNMGDRGTTPLFYAMCENDRPMVDLLLKHGARLDIGVQGDQEQELPLYFAALSHSSSIHLDILQHTIPTAPVSVDQLYYKGQNVIFYCIDNDVETELFESILLKCSSHVLTQHIQVFQSSMDAKHYAQKLEKTEYVAVIDKDHKTKLKQAVEDRDLISVKEMLYSESWSEQGLLAYFPDSRLCCDGQPLLHKAVLRQHLEIVREIAECLVYKCNIKLDSVKDQYFRTAYHYAHGMEEGKELVFLLEDMGMSEFAMDKDGRSPIAFKDRKGQKEMNELLLYQLNQDFSEPEPDPWSTPLPLPIIGYLSKCLHEHKHGNHHLHGHKHGKWDHLHKHGKLDHVHVHKHGKFDHSFANNSVENVKPLSDNDRMYTKINPQDFYQTKTLFSHKDKKDKNYRINGAIEYQTDHYQILDTNNPGDGIDDITSKDDGEEEDDYFESETLAKPSKADLELDNEDQEVESSEESGDRYSSQKPLLNPDELSDSTDTENEVYEFDHDNGEQDEDYDGDYSDLESEDEQDKDRLTNYCVIL